MEAYRDQYATLFNGGRDVVVMAVSVDPDTTLASWAREKDFPMLFLSDSGGAVQKLYGSWDERGRLEARNLFVIGPDGRIVHRMLPFQALQPAHYEALAAAVDAASPPDDDAP